MDLTPSTSSGNGSGCGDAAEIALKKYVPMIESSGLSEVGPVRADNQDSIHLPDGLYPPEQGLLFGIADGMGGYSHGAIASRLALQALTEALYQENRKPNPKAMRRGVETANLNIYKTAERLGAGRMGTTLTAAYVLEDTLHLVHVGDSRAYLIRDRRATCLTTDHTAVGELVRARLIPPAKVRTHAQRSILTKAVGIGLFVKPDFASLKLQEGDHLILCSDGAWSVIQDEEFAQVVAESRGIDRVSQALIDLALSRETDDNLSVVAVHVQSFIPVS
ncbi:MAG TPA: protein phosphatase 2C domain-containing protein [Anaerolineales bacterium]|nr:protein phosphatase 2C domain-containing protein [Anaerolineales bacterium]